MYIYATPPQLSTFFVAFHGTWGSMFPKLGVMFMRAHVDRVWQCAVRIFFT